MTARAARAAALCATGVAVAALGVMTLAATRPDPVVPAWEVALLSVDAASIVLGWLVLIGDPRSPVGPALTWLGACTAGTRAVEVWAMTGGTRDPLPGAPEGVRLSEVVWPWQLMGFVALLLVFPAGLLPGWRWKAVAVLAPVSAALVTGALLTDGTFDTAPSGASLVALVGGLGTLLAVLLAALAAPAWRYRRGSARDREQLRWFLWGASSVPVLLGGSWVAVSFGAPGWLAYSGFLVAMLVVVPAAVTVAILRHDLLDIDRLLSDTTTVVLTTVVSAAVFGSIVWGAGSVVGDRTGLGTAVAGFATALVLLPLYRFVHASVGGVLDRDRIRMLAAVTRFVEEVRDGRSEPEAVQDVLRQALADPHLRVLLRVPGHAGYLGMDGDPTDGEPTVSLCTQDSEIAALELGRVSARARRRATEAGRAAWVPLEVSRLRVELRAALQETRAGTERLLTASAAERRRLERELHDRAQPQVVAVGMRLRSIQRMAGVAEPVHAELDRSVAALGEIVAELRRIAHGLRPSRLDDGLEAALQGLVADLPLPLDLLVEGLDDDPPTEARSTTAYLLIAEALANSCKHADATSIAVHVHQSAGRLRIEVSDDGVGGVDPHGLTALRDRVASVGGVLDVHSPLGHGTRVHVEI